VTITVPVDLADAALTAEMAEDLAVVEAALRDTSFGGDEMFAEVSRYMMQAGGKRFRAMLVLLAARFGDPRDKRIVPAAVAIELTHLATLFHDDVMDEASIRRGEESANSRFGNSIAILAGDYLFARASRILADLGPDAIRIQAETFGRLVDGQLLETVGVRPGEDPLDHYMHVITEKTGSPARLRALGTPVLPSSLLPRSSVVAPQSRTGARALARDRGGLRGRLYPQSHLRGGLLRPDRPHGDRPGRV
jgi:heptaprenyl diphosphate synthase